MILAHNRALALSVIPRNSLRSSMAADNSPSFSNAVRIAVASASVTLNMPRKVALQPALTSWITSRERSVAALELLTDTAQLAQTAMGLPSMPAEGVEQWRDERR